MSLRKSLNAGRIKTEVFDKNEMDVNYQIKKKETAKNWYYKYRMKIVMACLSDMVEKELDAVIDEIFEDGVEYGRETYSEHEPDEPRYDLD